MTQPPADTTADSSADSSAESVDGSVDAVEGSPEATPEATPGTTFADLGLREELLQALSGLGYEEPTPVQREAIIPLVAGRDLVGQAATGTGKTAAFALPLLQRLPATGRGRAPSALVLVPTRELAIQVAEAVERYGAGLGARVLAVYGGQAIQGQLKELQRGVDVVVATPGRALDHLRRGSLALDELRTVVLDEADEMLDMGFAEDLEAILEATPSERQTALFSATLPPRIARIARQHLTDPVRLEVARETTQEDEAARVRQVAHVVARAWKTEALRRVLDVEAPTAAIVFARSRGEVDDLAEALSSKGRRAEALHGGLSQDQRDRVMARLRSGTAQLLVATDVAARGLDVDILTHVINYDVPAAPESYVHRIGRVGRGGREGVAITLAEPREQRMLGVIEKTTRQPLPVEPLPTVADLRRRRLERTRSALLLALEEEDLSGYRDLVASLTSEHDAADAADVAAAALHLLGSASGDGTADVEIPVAAARADRPARSAPGGSRGEGKRAPAAAGAPSAGRGQPWGKSGKRSLPGETTRLWIGLGKTTGVRPQDLVGAIANESSLSGKQIGAIQVSERFSLVEVPASSADDVVEALRGSIIRGRKATVRRERTDRG